MRRRHQKSSAIAALPAEIWLMIAKHTKDAKDLAAVSMATRQLHNSVPIPGCLVECRQWRLLMLHYANYAPFYPAMVKAWNQAWNFKSNYYQFLDMFAEAVAANRNEFLDQLLDTESLDPTMDGGKLLVLAAGKGNLRVIERLLKNPRADPNNFAAHEAALLGNHVDAFHLLIENAHEMDPSSSGNRLLLLACDRGHLEVVKRLLSDKRVDPSKPNDRALLSAASFSQLEVAWLLLADSRVNPSSTYTTLMSVMAEKGDLTRMKKLYSDPRIPDGNIVARIQVMESACKGGHLPVIEWLLSLSSQHKMQVVDNACLRLAAQHGHANVVAFLLKEAPFLDPMESRGTPLRLASSGGHLSVVEVLLADPRVNPADFNNVAIRRAATHGQTAIVERLLKDSRVDPFHENNNKLLYATIEEGHLDVLKILMSHPKANRTDHSLLYKAAESGQLEIVNYLLVKHRINPSAKQSAAFRKAAGNGHLKVVKRLLKEAKTDPSAAQNEAIRMASLNGYAGVVQCLLKDPRVDPSASSNAALRNATDRGNLKIVQMLLGHPKVDPSAMNNVAIQSACSRGYQSIVECLLKHPKFSSSSSLNQEKARILWESQEHGLMVLERLSDDRPSKRTKSSKSPMGNLVMVNIRKNISVIPKEPKPIVPCPAYMSEDDDDDSHGSECSCPDCEMERMEYEYDDYGPYHDYDMYSDPYDDFDDRFADYYGLL